MGLVVDPRFTPPPPPESILSSDGVLRAVADLEHAGVLLRADFGVRRTNEIRRPDFTGWLTYDGGGVSSLVVHGDGTATFHGAPGALLFPPSLIPTKAGDHWSLALQVKGPGGAELEFESYDAGGSSRGLSPKPGGYEDVAAGARLVWNDATVAPGAASVRPFLRVSVAGDYLVSAPLLEKAIGVGEFFSGDTPDQPGSVHEWTGPVRASSSTLAGVSVATPADRVRFYRGDGVPVRSGDAAWAPGSIAVAYDHEVPLGAASTWTAAPVFSDGRTGAPVAPVSMLVPEDLSRVDDVWLKCISDPSLSMRAVVTGLPDMSSAGRADFTGVPGDRLPASSWDVHEGARTTFSVLTSTSAERAALELLLDAGPLLLQTVSDVDLPDMYFLPGDVTWRWTDDSRHPSRVWTVELTEIERPATVDSPLRIPGRTCTEVLQSYPSCGALKAQVATNLELLGVS